MAFSTTWGASSAAGATGAAGRAPARRPRTCRRAFVGGRPPRASMTSPGGLFCAHKRLRTSCPECRPPPPPPREKEPKARAKKEAEPSSGGEDGEEREGGSGRRGPGKPLMPVKKRVKAPTRDEAERAEAWWVKDRKP